MFEFVRVDAMRTHEHTRAHFSEYDCMCACAHARACVAHVCTCVCVCACRNR
jgi:hypothetical protein